MEFFAPLWLGGVFGFLAILLIGGIGVAIEKVRLLRRPRITPPTR